MGLVFWCYFPSLILKYLENTVVKYLCSPKAFAKILSGLPTGFACQKAKNYIAIVALYDHVDLLMVCIDCFK
jgi:hypothetical protein